MKNFKLKMSDGLYIHGLIIEPKNKPEGIVQILHGMSEHKERYINFMKYLSDNGYVCVIHDHRGHGKSISSNNILGYFGNDNNILVEESYKVTKYIKKKYNDLNITLFGHSMGSLVARAYIQKYDSEINGLVLSGTPTYNPLSKIGIILANVICTLEGEKKHSKLLNTLSVGSYNKGFILKNEWLSFNKENILNYNEDKLCGFVFTNNGFKMLFKLLDNVYKKKKYEVNNQNLPILILGGKDDPVIGSQEKFEHLHNFLLTLGYENIKTKLYSNMRHEILNENKKQSVYKTILTFINKNS